MSALTELRGLSLITTKICSSFSKPMKFPNQDFLASLGDRQKIYMLCEQKQLYCKNTSKYAAYSGLDSGVRLDMSSDVGTEREINHY